MKRDENDPRAAWPGEDNQNGPWGAEAVLRWLASDGCAAAAAGLDLLPPMDGDERDEAAMARYMQNVYRVMWCHDLYLAISTLREVDPVKADEVADRTVLAAVAGDGYGEWLWQWADERGLDADAICDQARERAETKAMCEGCPVRERCLDYALAHRIDHGVWGGTSGRERMRMRRQRRKEAR